MEKISCNFQWKSYTIQISTSVLNFMSLNFQNKKKKKKFSHFNNHFFKKIMNLFNLNPDKVPCTHSDWLYLIQLVGVIKFSDLKLFMSVLCCCTNFFNLFPISLNRSSNSRSSSRLKKVCIYCLFEVMYLIVKSTF